MRAGLPRQIEPEAFQISQISLSQFGKIIRPQEFEPEKRAAHPHDFGCIGHAV
jgi:hypothetical protein